MYAARWLFATFLLELMSRTLYFNAIAKYGLLSKGVLAGAGVHVRPYHFALTGFWVLVYMWLKVGLIMCVPASAHAHARARMCVCT